MSLFPRTFAAIAVAFMVGCRTAPVVTSSFVADSLDATTLRTYTLSDETRRALETPVGNRVTVELDVPSSPVLRFAIGTANEGQTAVAKAVTFRLRVNERVVFEDLLRRSQTNAWFRREVDLSEYAGRRIRLSFEATAESATSVLPLWGNPVLVERGRAGARPDIILISIDCLRADHLGLYGYQRDTSPNLDAFAQESVVFRHAMATSSYTLPTHASMLTGLPPSLHGAFAGRPLSSSAVYAPELLAQAGYRVSGLVSAPYLSPIYGFDRGFHTYRLVSRRATQLVDEAIELLQEGEGQSRFLFFHLFDAHMPYVPPREFRTRFGERPRDITALLDRVESRSPPVNGAELENVIRLYDGEIAFVDQELGRFFEYLRSSGAFDRSLVLVTADHGEGFYEHGEWEHGRPWRFGPGLYEEILHVPLIVKWPEGASRTAGSVDDVVSQVDIFPTILRVAGLTGSTDWARDLREPGPRRTIFAELVLQRKDEDEDDPSRLVAVRDGRYKYIASRELEELFDLSTDPGETRNLLGSGSADLARFRNVTRAYLREIGAIDAGWEDVTNDERVLEQLKALGYVEP